MCITLPRPAALGGKLGCAYMQKTPNGLAVPERAHQIKRGRRKKKKRDENAASTKIVVLVVMQYILKRTTAKSSLLSFQELTGEESGGGLSLTLTKGATMREQTAS